jgi:hypothetical protein
MNNLILSAVVPLIITLTLSLPFQAAVTSKARKQRVIPIDSPKMPVSIYSASLGTISEDISELTYDLLNESDEEITRVDLRAFVVDAKGQIVHSEVGVNREGIKSKDYLESSMQVSRKLKEGERTYLCVEGVLGESGKWRIDSDALKNLKVIAWSKRPELKVSFERHLRFAAQDKSDILSLVLTDITRDKTKLALIGETPIVRTDDLDVDWSDLAGNSLLFLSSTQIRDLAQTNGTLKYLYVESLKAEGSTAQVRIVLRDQSSQYPAMRIPLTYTFVFSCTHYAGKWNIEWAGGLLSGGL